MTHQLTHKMGEYNMKTILITKHIQLNVLQLDVPHINPVDYISPVTGYGIIDVKKLYKDVFYGEPTEGAQDLLETLIWQTNQVSPLVFDISVAINDGEANVVNGDLLTENDYEFLAKTFDVHVLYKNNLIKNNEIYKENAIEDVLRRYA